MFLLSLLRMFSLFRHYSYPAVLRESLRFFVVIAGVVFSVSLFIAVRFANVSVLNEFEEAVDAMSGKSQVQLIGRSGGIPDEILRIIFEQDSIEHVLPVSKAQVVIHHEKLPSRKVWLIGTDVINELFLSQGSREKESSQDSFTDLLSYRALFVSSQLSDYLSSLREVVIGNDVERVSYRAIISQEAEGLFSLYDGNVLIADISLFQRIIGNNHRVDQLNLTLIEDRDAQNEIEALRKILPDSVMLVEPEQNIQQIAQSSEALRMNITFLSALSLFVAILLSFQVMSVIAYRRRGDFSTIISLGGSPRVIGTLFLLESSFLGLLGGVLGGVVGYFLSHYTTAAVQGTIHHLYTPLWMRGVQWDSGIFIEGVMLGFASAFLGALIPALTLFTKPPRRYFSKFQRRTVPLTQLFSFSLIGGVLIIFGLLMSDPSVMKFHSLTPFLAPSCLAFGIVSFAPLTLWGIARFSALIPSTQVRLSIDWALARLRDNAVTVGALGVAFGMLIGVTTMIESFRLTFQDWLGQILRADIFISSYEHGVNEDRTSKEKIFKWLRAQPAVEAVNTGLEIAYTYGSQKVFIRSTDMSVLERFQSIVFLSTSPSDWTTLKSGEAVFISEPMSRKFNLQPGDEVEVSFAQKTYSLPIVGVFQDFSSDLGAILMDQSKLEQLTDEEGRGLGTTVYLKDKKQSNSIRESLEKNFGDKWHIRDGNTLASEAIRIFNNTFAITYVLQTLTLSLACLFFFNTMILSVLEKKKECLTLRSIGAPFGYLRNILVSEASLLVFSALILGYFLGLLLSFVLVYRINIIFFGWLVKLSAPLSSLFVFSIGLIGIGVLAAVFVSYLFLRAIPLQALRYE